MTVNVWQKNIYQRNKKMLEINNNLRINFFHEAPQVWRALQGKKFFLEGVFAGLFIYGVLNFV